MAQHAHRRARRPVTAVGVAAQFSCGLVFLGLAALAALLFVHRPWPNRFDNFGFDLLPASPNSRIAHDLADLGSVWALVIGVGIAALATVWRDLLRAVALVIGPVLAVEVTERIAKPLVGRELTSGGGWSYPSGTVTAAAAVATALVLALPLVARIVASVPLGAAVVAVCAAVVRMRWHYPTDAAGGIGVGVGTVLLLDAIVHIPVLLRSATSSARRNARWRHEPLGSSG